ncbi:MAG: transglutaminase domain-containing protein [Pirellulales bacterium]|nr:transglutaminase domain-containing protein [Pirellulales bacterium]
MRPFRVGIAAILCLAAGRAFALPIEDVKILNDRAPDCSSLESIVATVTRGCKTDDQRVIALYNFCRYDHYHHAYPNEPDGISALKLINVYGWALCGGQHTVMAALWEAAGYPWRYRGWSSPGHTTVEVFYGGRWHYLDTFLKFYAWMPDPQSPGGRTIASQEDIKANPLLVTDGFQMDQARKVCYHSDNRFDYVGEKVHWTAPAFMVCGDTLPGVLSGVRSSRNAGSPRGWGGIRFDDPGYSTSVDLAPGYALTLDWDRIDDAFYFRGRNQGAYHSCGDKDYRNCPAIGPLLEPYHELRAERTWSNGTLVFRPDFRNDAFLAGLRQVDNVAYRDGGLHPQDSSRPGIAVVEMSSPYVVAKAAGKIASDDARVEVSGDLKSWKPADLANLTPAVAGMYRYHVRITFRKPVTAVELTSVVQHNQEALPYLAPGRNRITVTAANPETLGNNRLVVTYAYCLGQRDRTPEDVFDQDAEIARAHYASWSKTPVVVQRTMDRFPATFEIPVPTPKGKQPVYPRMLFLRREVLSPGQEPMAVPATPTTPEVGADEVLATLPEPWQIGTQPPPALPKRPTETEVRQPTKIGYVSKQGEVFDHHFVKWLKDDSDAWILLADFNAGNLPDLKSLASAKLVLFVEESHDRAPMQAAAAALQTPFEPGKPYDFAKLGGTLGWTIVAQGNGPGDLFVPPRRYEIDVTRAVRGWCRGEPFHGLAVRIVPNRGVDDGWTVRFTPPKENPLELRIERYTDR